MWRETWGGGTDGAGYSESVGCWLPAYTVTAWGSSWPDEQLELIMAKKWHACPHLSTDQHVVIKEGSRCSTKKHVNLRAFSDSRPPSVPLRIGFILSGKPQGDESSRCYVNGMIYSAREGVAWPLLNMSKSGGAVAGNIWTVASFFLLFFFLLTFSSPWLRRQ